MDAAPQKLQVHFAPLQGYTDAIYRRCHAKCIGGVAAYYSPFVRMEKGDVRKKDLWDVAFENNEGVKLVPQIIFNGPDEFDKLVEKILELGYSEIDLNMGCPYPMQTGRGRGSGILPRVDVVQEIADRINALEHVAFSVKMRLGLESPEESQSLLPILNETRLRHVTVHPRVGRQQYKGALDMTTFEKFYEGCVHPLCFNGDIVSVADIQGLQERYPGLCAVMIGRGLLARPTLALEYGAGREWTEGEKSTAVFAMHAEMLEQVQETLADDVQKMNRMRSFWEYQEKALPKKIYKRVMKCVSWKEYLDLYVEGRHSDVSFWREERPIESTAVILEGPWSSAIGDR